MSFQIKVNGLSPAAESHGTALAEAAEIPAIAPDASGYRLAIIRPAVVSKFGGAAVRVVDQAILSGSLLGKLVAVHEDAAGAELNDLCPALDVCGGPASSHDFTPAGGTIMRLPATELTVPAGERVVLKWRETGVLNVDDSRPTFQVLTLQLVAVNDTAF